MFIAVEATRGKDSTGKGHKYFLADLVAALNQNSRVEVVSPLFAQAASLGTLVDQLIGWTDYIAAATLRGDVVVADGWFLTANLRVYSFGARWQELFDSLLPYLAYPDACIVYDEPKACPSTRRWLLERSLLLDVPLFVHTPGQPLAGVIEFVCSHGLQGGENICPLILTNGTRLPHLASV